MWSLVSLSCPCVQMGPHFVVVDVVAAVVIARSLAPYEASKTNSSDIHLFLTSARDQHQAASGILCCSIR